MGDTKFLLEEECEFKYIPEMEMELNYADKLRNISHDFVDRVLVSGEVSYTDYFLLRAVAFYRFATAEMVAEYFLHFKNYYGNSEVSKLLIPNVSPDTGDINLNGWGDFDKDEDMIRYRLNRLAKKYLLLSYSITYPYEGRNKLKVVYCINYTTYSIVRSFFGPYVNFSSAEIGYERYYSITPLYRMMEHLHACRVAVLAFRRHKRKVTLLGDKEIIFGHDKKRMRPVMTAKVENGNKIYKIIVEPIHFSFDDRLITEEEQRQNIIAHLKNFKALINHYNYMERVHEKLEKTECIRFLLAVENFECMKKIVKIMNESMYKYNEKVFFTTDHALKNSETLFEAVLVAKKTKSKVTDKEHLGLIRPSIEYLLASDNEWVLE